MCRCDACNRFSEQDCSRSKSTQTILVNRLTDLSRRGRQSTGGGNPFLMPDKTFCSPLSFHEFRSYHPTWSIPLLQMYYYGRHLSLPEGITPSQSATACQSVTWELHFKPWHNQPTGLPVWQSMRLERWTSIEDLPVMTETLMCWCHPWKLSLDRVAGWCERPPSHVSILTEGFWMAINELIVPWFVIWMKKMHNSCS